MKNIVAINFSELFQSARGKWNSKLSEKQNLKKVPESLYVFLTIPDEVKKYAEMMQSNCSDKFVHPYNIEICLFDLELELINTKPMIKNKLK